VKAGEFYCLFAMAAAAPHLPARFGIVLAAIFFLLALLCSIGTGRD
jgi:hypothetical protein